MICELRPLRNARAVQLAPMKVPRAVAFLDELPQTPTHKVARAVLRADHTLRGKAVDLQLTS
jgi:carnitine-CoA ligase